MRLRSNSETNQAKRFFFFKADFKKSMCEVLDIKKKKISEFICEMQPREVSLANHT